MLSRTGGAVGALIGTASAGKNQLAIDMIFMKRSVVGRQSAGYYQNHRKNLLPLAYSFRSLPVVFPVSREKQAVRIRLFQEPLPDKTTQHNHGQLFHIILIHYKGVSLFSYPFLERNNKKPVFFIKIFKVSMTRSINSS